MNSWTDRYAFHAFENQTDRREDAVTQMDVLNAVLADEVGGLEKGIRKKPYKVFFLL